MLTKEQLAALGLTEDQITAVLKAHKDAIDGTYVTKVAFEAERAKVKAANDTIADRDKQIKDLGEFKGTAEQLQSKVAELEQQNKDNADKYAADLAKTQAENSIKLALMDSVIDVDDVLPKLDLTKITITEGKITAGLNEQLDVLKKAKPHYFKEQSTSGNGSFPKGFNIFGRTPQEGSEQHESGEQNNAAVDFGKQLAQFKVAGDTAAAKAQEIYFK